jgi:uncharacterized alkaline shock family protein YloU
MVYNSVGREFENQSRTAQLANSEDLPIPGEDNKPPVVGIEPLSEDRVTIAPGVLLTMIRMAALTCSGVVQMGNTPGGVNRWLRRTPSERGVQVYIEGETVTVDLYIIADADTNLKQLSIDVQTYVARAIEENIGMHVGAVNIHIEDVVFTSTMD